MMFLTVSKNCYCATTPFDTLNLPYGEVHPRVPDEVPVLAHLLEEDSIYDSESISDSDPRSYELRYGDDTIRFSDHGGWLDQNDRYHLSEMLNFYKTLVLRNPEIHSLLSRQMLHLSNLRLVSTTDVFDFEDFSDHVYTMQPVLRELLLRNEMKHSFVAYIQFVSFCAVIGLARILNRLYMFILIICMFGYLCFQKCLLNLLHLIHQFIKWTKTLMRLVMSCCKLTFGCCYVSLSILIFGFYIAYSLLVDYYQNRRHYANSSFSDRNIKKLTEEIQHAKGKKAKKQARAKLNTYFARRQLKTLDVSRRIARDRKYADGGNACGELSFSDGIAHIMSLWAIFDAKPMHVPITVHLYLKSYHPVFYSSLSEKFFETIQTYLIDPDFITYGRQSLLYFYQEELKLGGVNVACGEFDGVTLEAVRKSPLITRGTGIMKQIVELAAVDSFKMEHPQIVNIAKLFNEKLLTGNLCLDILQYSQCLLMNLYTCYVTGDPLKLLYNDPQSMLYSEMLDIASEARITSKQNDYAALQARWNKIKSSVQVFKTNTNFNSMQTKALAETERALLDALDCCKRRLISGAPSPPAFVIQINGPPDIGKSTTALSCLTLFQVLDGITDPGGDYIQMIDTTEEKFDSTYAEHKVYGWLDEVQSRLIKEGELHDLTRIFQMIQVFARPVPKAAVDEKGSYYYNYKALVLTSNIKNMSVKGHFTTMNAALRRVEFLLEEVVKPEYAPEEVPMSFSSIDKTKTVGKQLEYCKLYKLSRRTLNNGYCIATAVPPMEGMIQYEYLGENYLEYDDMMKLIEYEYSTFRKGALRVKEKMDSIVNKWKICACGSYTCGTLCRVNKIAPRVTKYIPTVQVTAIANSEETDSKVIDDVVREIINERESDDDSSVITDTDHENLRAQVEDLQIQLEQAKALRALDNAYKELERSRVNTPPPSNRFMDFWSDVSNAIKKKYSNSPEERIETWSEYISRQFQRLSSFLFKPKEDEPQILDLDFSGRFGIFKQYWNIIALKFELFKLKYVYRKTSSKSIAYHFMLQASSVEDFRVRSVEMGNMLMKKMKPELFIKITIALVVIKSLLTVFKYTRTMEEIGMANHLTFMNKKEVVIIPTSEPGEPVDPDSGKHIPSSVSSRSALLGNLISHVIPVGSMQEVHFAEKVKRNIFRVHITNDQGVSTRAHGFGFHGKLFGTVAHVFPSNYWDDPTNYVYLQVTGVSMKTNPAQIFSQRTKKIGDFVYFYLHASNPVPDLSKFVSHLTKDTKIIDTGVMHTFDVSINEKPGLIQTPVPTATIADIKYKSLIRYKPTDQLQEIEWTATAYKSPVNTIQGQSGGILIVKDRVMGMLVSSVRDTFSCFIPIPSITDDEVLQLATPCFHVANSMECKLTLAPSVTHSHALTQHLSTDSAVEYFGVSDPREVHQARPKSQYYPSTITEKCAIKYENGYVLPCDGHDSKCYTIPILTARTRVDDTDAEKVYWISPLLRNVANLVVPKLEPPIEFAQKAAWDYIQKFNHLTVDKPICRATLHQVLNGDEGITSLKKTSSAGLLFPGKVSDYCDGSPGHYVLKDKKSYVAFLTSLRDGIEPFMPLKTSLKDEIITVEKNETGRVRAFNGCSLHETLAAKQYLDPIFKFMQDHPYEFELAVGVNCLSGTWKDWYLKMKSHKHHMALDFKNNDTSQLRVLLLMLHNIFEVIMNIMRVQEIDPNYKRIVHRLLDRRIHWKTCIGVEIFGPLRGGPSGWVGTSVINSIITALYYRMAWHILKCPGWFSDHVFAMNFGDDNIGSHNQSNYTQPAIRDVLAVYGMVVTGSDKSSSMEDFTPLEDITFLKRGFKPISHNGTIIVACPLEESSIERMLMFGHSEKQDRLAIELKNISDAQKQWFLHGEQIFNSRTAWLQQTCNQAGLNIELIGEKWYTFDELFSKYMSQELIIDFI